MTDVVLRITSQPSGDWSAQWEVAGVAAGQRIPIPAEDAKTLADFARQFEQQFGRSEHDGLARRPVFPVSALDGIGRQFFERWCRPVWDAVEAKRNGPRRLFVHSDCSAALNLPWELLPLGADREPLGCDAA